MFSLADLDDIIARRAQASAETSYTKTLLDKGVVHCAKKFGEEAIEATIAAVGQDDAALRAEAADVLYHLIVMLRARGVALNDCTEQALTLAERVRASIAQTSRS